MKPIILGFYGLFLLAFGVVSFFGLYQLWHFGYVGDASRRMIILYLGLAGAIIVGSLIALIVWS